MKNAILGFLFGVMALVIGASLFAQYQGGEEEFAGIGFVQSRLPTIATVTSTLFGSATGTPITLTASFNSASTTLVSYGQVNHTWDIDYTPSSSGSYLEFYIELERGNGFRPIGATEVTTSSINIYAGASSTLPGVVVRYPPAGTATVAGRRYSTSEFNRTFVSNNTRVSVREVTSANFGTLWAGAILVPTK